MKIHVYFRFSLILYFLSIAHTFLQAQNSKYFVLSEKQLVTVYSDIFTEKPFNREMKANQFFDKFYAVVEHDSSFFFPFSGLQKIGKIYSSDQKICIYSWNIPINIDDNIYYGIIQYYSNHDNKYIAIKLHNAQKQDQQITSEEWPGALYYQIAETRNDGQIYYTLLGLNLNNALSNKKVIDVISIDNSDRFSFCEKMIENKGKLVDRLVFEYNEKAIMMLQYDKNKKMIVFDHLSPQRPSLEGNYQFYGPDFTYDGLKFEKGIWKYYSNINVTN
jgi:hypothetical protein